ncbi:cystathionine beta-lyase [Thermocatellispora tengchongensis]|uniref:cysteine-S-conjugate beta-lyase n=1 Tax=Thermocatellispora tengchongensis TaxID=1073253 RepID=A0A840PBA7_9ACTN|nr:aminotransferase class I/II-fold pyridoxal phosphate-dependent enzyme [Thermocatellispora tengchongensis]MBB5135141.1 cystathionine beta-lyase [Thermocatellispora tengchongensis]
MGERFGVDRLSEADARRRTGVKWAQPEDGVIPAWIADMDFPVAPAIVAAVRERAELDLGYPVWLDRPQAGPLAEAFAERMERRHGWRPDPEHVRAYSDINQALQVLLHVMTEPGDGVALHVPNYPPFLETLAQMGRTPVHVPMRPEGGTWTFDPELIDGRCRVLLLVNPHNPTGRVLTRDELGRIAELAERHDLLVISDEIHADLVYEPHRHIPFATLLPERTITLTSATKAFNLGGIRCSVAHIGAARARKALAAQPAHLFGAANLLGVEATVAAWRHGDAWLEEVVGVLDRNRRLLADRLPPEVGYRMPEATYLAWLDFGGLGLDEEPAEFLYREARVMASPGPLFGPGGPGHVRLNFATSLPIFEEILGRIGRACTTP